MVGGCMSTSFWYSHKGWKDAIFMILCCVCMWWACARPDVWCVCNWPLNCSLNCSSCLMYAFRQTHLRTHAKHLNNSQSSTSHLTPQHTSVWVFFGVISVFYCPLLPFSVWKSLLVDKILILDPGTLIFLEFRSSYLGLLCPAQTCIEDKCMLVVAGIKKRCKLPKRLNCIVMI